MAFTGLPPEVSKRMLEQIMRLPTKGKIAFLLLLEQCREALRTRDPDDWKEFEYNVRRWVDKFIIPQAEAQGGPIYHVCVLEEDDPEVLHGNLQDDCAKCSRRIVYSPSAPEHAVRVCTECAADVVREGAETGNEPPTPKRSLH